MTHKRCRKTGKRAEVVGDQWCSLGVLFAFSQYTLSEHQGLTYITSYCNVEKAEREILRHETKLDRLLDGTDE